MIPTAINEFPNPSIIWFKLTPVARPNITIKANAMKTVPVIVNLIPFKEKHFSFVCYMAFTNFGEKLLDV
jgi:hypothetical protein